MIMMMKTTLTEAQVQTRAEVLALMEKIANTQATCFRKANQSSSSLDLRPLLAITIKASMSMSTSASVSGEMAVQIFAIAG